MQVANRGSIKFSSFIICNTNERIAETAGIFSLSYQQISQTFLRLYIKYMIMGFKNTLGILHAHSDEINKIIERLEASDDIRSIDLDLLLEKLRTIYDVVSDLRNEVKTMKKIVEPEAEKSSFQEVDKVVDKKAEESRSRQDENDTVTAETESVKRENRGSDEQVKEKKKGTEEPILSDRFKTDNRTINEEIGRQSKQDISSQLSMNPISSVMGALGLNEKFELINELFDGDKVKFDKTMQVLNSSGSFVEAYSYLEEQFDWEMENPYVQRILELIRRKLIVRRNEQ
jgi:hypothetical protein